MEEETFTVLELVRRYKQKTRQTISRQTVYRYIEIGVFEPAGRNDGRMVFTDDHVQCLKLIKRLMGPRFRYQLAQIRDQIEPLFSPAEFVAMADGPSDRLENEIRRRRPR